MRRTTTVLLAAAALAVAPLAGSAAADDQGAKSSGAQMEQGTMRSGSAASGSGSVAGAAATIPSDEIIGSDVLDSQGQELGSVRKLLIDKDGKIDSAVISLGGVFGMGSRQVKVPWSSLQMKPKADDPDEMVVTASRDTLQNAPQFEENKGMARSVLDAINPNADDDQDPRAAGRTNE
ncbi:MAG TPA: PRC-barrel domain-containing protein [Candidatus Binatia bacterium]